MTLKSECSLSNSALASERSGVLGRGGGRVMRAAANDGREGGSRGAPSTWDPISFASGSDLFLLHHDAIAVIEILNYLSATYLYSVHRSTR